MLREIICRIDKRSFSATSLVFVNFSATTSYSFTSLYLTRHLHFTAETAGHLVSTQALFALVASYGIGSISSLVGARNAVIASFVFAALAYCFISVATQPSSIAIALSVVAIARSIFRPTYNQHILAIFSEEQRARAYSLFVMASNAGVGLAAVLGGWLMYLWPPSLFIVDGLICLLSGFAAAAILFRSYDSLPHVNSVGSKPQRPWADRKFTMICGLYFLISVVKTQTNFLLPVYLIEHKNIETHTWGYMNLGLCFSILFLSLPTTSFLRRYNARIVILISSSAMCFSVAAIPFTHSFPALLTCWSFFVAGEIAFYPALMGQAMHRVTGLTVTSYMAFYYSFLSAANLIGPVGTGWIYTNRNPEDVWLLPGFIGAICVAICAFWAVVERSGRTVKSSDIP